MSVTLYQSHNSTIEPLTIAEINSKGRILREPNNEPWFLLYNIKKSIAFFYVDQVW